MAELIKALVDLLVRQHPAIVVAIGVIIVAAWIVKQYYGYDRNRSLFENRLFQLFVLLTILVTGGYYVFLHVRMRPPTMPSVEGAVRVVVLPFENLTDLKTLRDGMAWSLTDGFLNSRNIIAYNERARLNLLITERGRQNEYDMSDVLSIGNAVRADLVIWGTVQRYQRDRYHATVRLVDLKERKILKPIVEEAHDDVFTLQKRIFERLITTLDKEMTTDRRQRGLDVIAATANLEAYDHYVKGRNSLLMATPEGYQKAIRWFEEAIRLDPNYSLAWAGMASSYAFWGYERSWNNQSYQEFHAKALAAALRAVDLGPSLSETHRALALVYAYWLPPRREKVEAEAWKALDINPNDYEAYFAIAKARDGDEQYLLKALAINPDYILAYNWLTTRVYAPQRRWNEAIKTSKRILELNPRHATQYANLADFYLQEGMLDEAVQAARQAVALKPDLHPAHLVLGDAYYRKQSYRHAEAAFRRAVALNEKDPAAHFMLAMVYEQLGETQKAIAQWKRVLPIASPEDAEFARRRLKELKP